jgi:DNA-binding MarR family transcriptional regulator
VNLAFLLMAAGRRIRERVEDELRADGITVRHVSALGHLRREPGLSYSELARRAGITVQSMQATLTALEDAGAVERDGGGRGRAVTLTITPRGEQLLDGALRAFDRADRDLAALLTPEAAQDLATLLAGYLGVPLAPDPG